MSVFVSVVACFFKATNSPQRQFNVKAFPNLSSFIRRLPLVLLACSSLFLMSCASQVSSLKIDQVVELKDEAGYLLLGLDTKHDLMDLIIDGPKKIMFTGDDLRTESRYLMVPLPAGKYNIKQVRFSRFSGYRLLGGLWDFEVKEGVISYVGDFVIGRRYGSDVNSLHIQNRSSFAFEYLRENFNETLSRKRLVYSGPGEDRLFRYLEDLNSPLNSAQTSSSKGGER